MGILDTITPTDAVILDLHRNHQNSSHAIVVSGRPDSPEVAAIRSEVEGHLPDYQMQAEYGLYAGARGTKLSMRPRDLTLQDAFFDGFERKATYTDPEANR